MIKNNTSKTPQQQQHNVPPTLEVKSKYDAEFRRFGLNKQKLSKFDEFYKFLERLHGLFDIQFIVCYTDRDGELLPINNDCNYNRVLNVTVGILRLIIQRRGECYDPSSLNSKYSFINNNVSSSKNSTNIMNQLKNFRELGSSHNNMMKPIISYPEDFRPVSAIIDVDIVPETYRRVRLHKHKSSKPLGFYIRDGRSIRVTPNGVEQVPSIFISRLMPGGLAESTGLLSVNDEVIEVNGIEVAGKTLDQVTDMMIANSSNLIITVKPANQRYNLNRTNQLNDSRGSNNQNIPSSKSGPSLSGASSVSSNSSFANSFNNKNRSSNNGNNNKILSTNSVNLITNTSTTTTTLTGNGGTGGGCDTISINSNSHQQRSSAIINNSQTLRISDEDDDEDEDEEIHDQQNSNDDKILTL